MCAPTETLGVELSEFAVSSIVTVTVVVSVPIGRERVVEDVWRERVVVRVSSNDCVVVGVGGDPEKDFDFPRGLAEDETEVDGVSRSANVGLCERDLLTSFVHDVECEPSDAELSIEGVPRLPLVVTLAVTLSVVTKNVSVILKVGVGVGGGVMVWLCVPDSVLGCVGVGGTVNVRVSVRVIKIVPVYDC